MESDAESIALWIGGVLVAVGVIVAGLWLWRTRPWRGPRTRYPVVLVHGILGFEEIGIGTVKQNYFRGITEHLRRLGVKVHQPALPSLGSVTERAQSLHEALSRLPEKRLNIVAHSMGGLDARYAISRLGCHKRVASLTTIGTPHRGTPVADLGAVLLGEKIGLGRLFAIAGLAAVRDLSTRQMEPFNQEVVDVPGVRYASVVASVDPEAEHLHRLLIPSHKYLKFLSGPNDGLVPVTSQRWGRVLFEIQADHWAQIGWSPGLDAPAFYEQLACRLRAGGL
jgi:triacylglycerol lipase